MGYRELSVVEIREVLRQWILGDGYRRIADRGLVDRKTVRRYVEAARRLGLCRDQGIEGLSDELIGGVVSVICGGRPAGAHGEAWGLCVTHRKWLEQKVGERLRITKIHELFQRQVGPRVPYRTLCRFVRQELGVGIARTTVRIDDCAPGSEIQVDFGQMGHIVDSESGRRRVVHGLIFTAVYSRHMFVWLTYRQTSATVIEGCERAWVFFGGVFKVLIPDNLKAVVGKADPLAPKFIEGFLDYAQARGFVIDPARIRDPTGKARVERSVPYVRESFFRGESFRDLADANERAEIWCRCRAGMRIHGTTQRRPLEVFEAEAQAALLPVPEAPYDIPRFDDVTVQRDQHITIGKALYSVPEQYVGEQVHVRCDSSLVRIYFRRQLIKTHPTAPPGGRHTDDHDFPVEKQIYARRDVEALQKLADGVGPSTASYASQILEGPAPWQRMRAVYRLLGLARRYGAEAVEEACRRALELDVVDVTRIERMVKHGLDGIAAPEPRPPSASNIISLRFARPDSHFALTDKGGPS